MAEQLGAKRVRQQLAAQYGDNIKVAEVLENSPFLFPSGHFSESAAGVCTVRCEEGVRSCLVWRLCV